MLNFSNNALMNNIIDPNQFFDFTKLSLANPSGVQGGAYFTKILYNSKPLYIQTHQSFTRQGFVKTGKKFYIDLMFDNNSSNIINWFENLEDKCQKLLFEKSETWFQNTLELNDIETAFNSTIRVYKSGKYYLVRCNAKSNINNEPAVKIYNENENAIPYTDINSETKIISILEIQGIKFTSRNFQIEIEIKQMMVLDDEQIFESCLIKTNNVKHKSDENNIVEENNKGKIELIDKQNKTNIDIHLENNKDSKNEKNEYLDIIDDLNIEEDVKNDNKDNVNIDNNINKDENNEMNIEKNNSKLDNNINDNTKLNVDNIHLEIEDLDKLDQENSDDLKEIDFNVDINNQNNLETLTLKKPNQVYFELYKKAKEKAKLAKKAAIIAYLEVKNIKKTYMIDNLNDSDSDSEFDNDLDAISENELEDF